MSTTLRCTQLPVRAQEGVREETGTRRDGVHSLQRYRVGWRPREGNNHADGFAKLKAGKTPVLDPGCDDTWGVSPWAQLSLTRVLEAFTPSFCTLTSLVQVYGFSVRPPVAFMMSGPCSCSMPRMLEDPGPPFSHSTTGAVAWSGEDDVASQ